MHKSETFWLRAAGVTGFLAVALGAFGAHLLKPHLAELGTAAVYETGVHYHLAHALALLGVALLARDGRRVDVSGWAFLIGVILFSGSLYMLALTGVKLFGAITPFGGVGFLVGWAALSLCKKATSTT